MAWNAKSNIEQARHYIELKQMPPKLARAGEQAPPKAGPMYGYQQAKLQSEHYVEK